MLRSLLIAILLLPATSPAQDSARPAWPGPPERARIRHLETLHSGTRFDRDGGFLGGILSGLFGGEKTSTWLIQPVGIAVSRDGKLYVADPGAPGVHIIDTRGGNYDLALTTESGPFISPVGVAVDAEGLVYVADSERGEIVVLDSDGDPEGRIGGMFGRPTGVQVSGDTLYVTDTGLHKVFILGTDGRLLGSFGARGAGASEFNFPVAVAVRDSVFVLDALNYRVQGFAREGAFGSVFGDIGNVAGRFASPKGIALDSDGNIYVTDGMMDILQIFDRAGRLLLIVGRNGTRDGEFVMPAGIAIGNDDTVYVVDAFNRRIQIFRYYP